MVTPLGAFMGAVWTTAAARPVTVLLDALRVWADCCLGGCLASTAARLSEAVRLEDRRLAVRPSAARGVPSIAIVAMGALLGREAAPQLTGTAAASRLA
jgi:hypothetical protein